MDDDLYQVPLGEFTAARDALAARLKAAGDKDGAGEVKRARKPSVPAWAANQVVRAGDEWERLRAAAATLRKAHGTAASPEARHDAGREQREALQACEARAADVLAQQGHAASPAVLQKVGHTLLALAYGAPGAGRLDHELPPPGFDALAGLTLAAPPPRAAPPVSAASAPRAPVRPAKDAALTIAESRHAEGRRAVLKARARLDAEEERLRALESQLEDVRRAVDEARRQLEAAQAEEAAAEAALRALGVK